MILLQTSAINQYHVHRPMPYCTVHLNDKKSKKGKNKNKKTLHYGDCTLLLHICIY